MEYIRENSFLKIKKIAVCMYGQYRTGDICIDFLKKFYDMPGYQVDFFCSLKPYSTSYTRKAFNKKNNRQILHIDKENKEIIQKNISTIKNKLNPKKFKLYTIEYESELKNIDKSIVHSKVLAGWVDSLMLKTMYEVEQNITYDMVVMQRYDVIIYPKEVFKAMVRTLDGVCVSNRNTFRTNNKDFLIFDPIQFYRKQPGIFSYANAQDLWTVGFGTALDTLAYEALNYIPSKFNSMYDTKKFYDGYPFTDTHEMIATIANKMHIPNFSFGAVKEIDEGEYTLPFCNFMDKNYIYRPVAFLPIRDTYFDDSKFSPGVLHELNNNELKKFYEESGPKWYNGV